MAGKNDKWVMFRNYMANELGITKEDIREWIKDAIHDEVKDVVAHTYGRCDIEEMVRRTIIHHDYYGRKEGFNSDVIKATASILASEIEIKPRKKKEN